MVSMNLLSRWYWWKFQIDITNICYNFPVILVFKLWLPETGTVCTCSEVKWPVYFDLKCLELNWVQSDKTSIAHMLLKLWKRFSVCFTQKLHKGLLLSLKKNVTSYFIGVWITTSNKNFCKQTSLWCYKCISR